MPNQKHMKPIEFLKKWQNHWTLLRILLVASMAAATASCLLLGGLHDRCSSLRILLGGLHGRRDCLCVLLVASISHKESIP
jgi:hypothetical protein